MRKSERINTSRKWTGWGLLVVALVLVFSTSAFAVKSADKVCKSVARQAKKAIWDSMRETGDDLFCRKPWVKRLPHEFAACGLHTQTNRFGNRVKNKWNAFFDKVGGEWATIGARGISVEWEEGTIRGGFKRTFFGAGLGYNTTTVEVVKEGGRAEANITVCELDYDSNVINTHRRTFPNGKGNEGMTRKVTIENKDTRIYGVVVDTPAGVNRFEYRARLLNEPVRNDIGPVRGVADLHVHQLVNLTFGGRMYWGLHEGPKKSALAEETINGKFNVKADGPVDAILQAITEDGMDANILLYATKSKMDDEGFFQLGGEGHPSYKDWPHHADRSHQQVHMSWVKEAHERNKGNGSNLNLMVVSLVNNDILCSALKFVDPYGNVPKRNSAGEVLGWESASWGCPDHENVLRQIEAAHDLENKYPWYRIAMTPWHARQIIDDGDLAVVLSIETDKPLSGKGGNYGVWLDQLDVYRALGVTTMQVVHESNSKFCGAAPHRGMMQALQAIHWPRKSIGNLLRSGSTFNKDGNGYNGLGLTKQGEKLIDAMVARNMPIDLAHGSRRCRLGIMDRVPNGYGLYDSHTKFKRLMEPGKGQKNYGTDVLDREKEFLIMENLLPKYVEHQVLVGLRTASVDVYDAPDAKVKNDCPGSARSFAQLVQYANDSNLDFAYGTDFNTGVSQLGPRYGNERCFAYRVSQMKHNKKKNKHQTRPASEEEPMPRSTRIRIQRVEEIDGTNYYYDGLATYGWLPELTDDLVNLGTPGAEKLRDSAEKYLAMWERAYDAQPSGTPRNVGRPNTVEAGSVALGLACTKDNQCSSGKCSSLVGRGVCVCNEDKDCPSGFCNMGVDLRTNACQPLKANNESCAVINGDRTCKSGHCSGFGRCYEPDSVALGGTCYTDKACAAGKCSSVDGLKGSCVCKADSDCGSKKWCDKGLDLKKNSCKKKLKKGEVCGVYGDLGHGHRCKSGKCSTKTKLGVPGVTKLKCQ